MTKPRVTYDGTEYVVRSVNTEIPDLTAMPRMAALVWLNQNTYGRGINRRAPNRLAGMSEVLKIIVVSP